MYEILVPLLILAMVVALLAAEDFLPTGGALALIAGGALIFLLYLGFSTSRNLGISYLVAEVLVVPATYAISTLLIQKTGLKRLVSLRPPEAAEVDISREGPDLDRLIGLRGRAVTTLRPSGMVDFDGRRLDGVAESGLIEIGTSVLAIQVRSGRLVVQVETDQIVPKV
jgi:membrane-bound ClpP family serine protease